MGVYENVTQELSNVDGFLICGPERTDLVCKLPFSDLRVPVTFSNADSSETPCVRTE